MQRFSNMNEMVFYLTGTSIEILYLNNKVLESFRWSLDFFKRQYKSLIKKYSTKYVRLILDTGYEVNVSTSKFHTDELNELFKQTKYIKNDYQCIPSEHIIFMKNDGKKNQSTKTCYYGKVIILDKEISNILKFITKHFRVVSKITLQQYSQNLIAKLSDRFKDRDFILLKYDEDNILTLIHYNKISHNFIDNESISERHTVHSMYDIIDVLETYSYPCVIDLTNDKSVAEILMKVNIPRVSISVKGLKIGDDYKSFLLQDVSETEISLLVKDLPEDTLDGDLLHKSFIPRRIVKRNNCIYNFIAFLLCALFLYLGIQYGNSLIDESFWTIPAQESFTI